MAIIEGGTDFLNYDSFLSKIETKMPSIPMYVVSLNQSIKFGDFEKVN